MIEEITSSTYVCNAKSLHRSRAGSHFYGTEYENWGDFPLVGNTEKNSNF